MTGLIVSEVCNPRELGENAKINVEITPETGARFIYFSPAHHNSPLSSSPIPAGVHTQKQAHKSPSGEHDMS